MRILQYKGISLTSRLIRFQTRSPYSHTAVELDDGRVVEAWRRGVHVISDFREGHTKGTEVHGYDIEGDIDSKEAEHWLMSQVGKKYDFLSVARFATRRQAPANDRWFCSELALYAIHVGGVKLLNGNPSAMSPRDVALSPLLRLVELYEV